MEIKISNWDKYNPRKDLKSLTWIRLDGDIGFSESLFGLSVNAKWLWIFLLSYSSKKNSGDFSIEKKYLSHHSGIKICELDDLLQDLFRNGLLLINTVSSRTRSDSPGNVTDTIENVSYERTIRTNEHSIPVCNGPLVSDEVDQEIEESSLSADAIAEIWNIVAKPNMLPCVKIPLSKDRIKQMQKPMKEFTEIRDWEKIIEQIQENPFNLGENERKWKANFDWLFNSTKFNYRKLWEAYESQPS